MKIAKTSLVLAVIILIASLTIAAKKQETKASWYENRHLINAVMKKGEWITLDTFTDKREGFVKLQGDTFYPEYTGLMKISGTCSTKREPVKLIIMIADRKVVYTDDEAASFSIVVPAEPVQIKAVQYSDVAANMIVCNLLFEAVK